MLLLLHMLPFTVRYSLANILVVMVAASSSGCPCRQLLCPKDAANMKQGLFEWKELLLLDMLPFTVRYSLANVLVVMNAATSNGLPCRQQ